jgi:Ca-activated chloride channel family protein
MFNPAIYENSQPDGFAVLEVVDADGDSGTRAAPHRFVPLRQSELHGVIMGPLADLRLTQHFGYTRADDAGPIEARYRFPLPGDAAVSGVTVRFGDVAIAATLQERTQAEAEYAAAKAEGRQGALATRETSDVFTLQITGLQPDEPVTIETHYVQLAQSEPTFAAYELPKPQWFLRIPLTTAPRYARSDERDSRAAQGQPLALLRDPGHRFALDLTFQGVAAVTSPTHKLTTATIPDPNGAITATAGLRVQLAAGAVIPDRDCLLRWSPRQAHDVAALSLLRYRDETARRLYFLALVAPPLQAPTTLPNREVILLVDHSGSMSGPKWAAADWAVEHCLRSLQPTDTFALAMFHYATRWFAQAPQPATATAIDEAVAWLYAQLDSGGTELGVALEQGLHLPRRVTPGDTPTARHLLIVTDAAVSDAARILRLADQEASRVDRRRISVLCIDAAPNAFLANELAERGGGVARFLTSDPAQNDIVTALEEVLLAWAQPLAVNLQLTVNQPAVSVSGQQARTAGDGDGRTVIDLGDLMAGQTLWVAGAAPLPAEPVLTFDLFSGVDGQERLATQTVAVADDESAHSATAALKALYGARRVAALEYLMNSGLDDAHLADLLARLGYAALPAASGATAVYAENQRRQATALIRPLLVQEALDYGLASSETAFVATRQEAGQPVTASVAVANALPAGWSGDFLSASPGAPATRSQFAAAMPMMQASPPPAPSKQTMAQHVLPSRLPSLAPLRRSKAAEQGTASAANAQWHTLFAGVPADGAEIILFDSQGTDPLPATTTFTALQLQVADDVAAALAQLATPDLILALYIADRLTPRATVRLRDLLQAGLRPMNLQRVDGAVVVVLLRDPTHRLRGANVAFTLLIQG